MEKYVNILYGAGCFGCAMICVGGAIYWARDGVIYIKDAIEELRK